MTQSPSGNHHGFDDGRGTLDIRMNKMMMVMMMMKMMMMNTWWSWKGNVRENITRRKWRNSIRILWPANSADTSLEDWTARCIKNMINDVHETNDETLSVEIVQNEHKWKLLKFLALSFTSFDSIFLSVDHQSGLPPHPRISHQQNARFHGL